MGVVLQKYKTGSSIGAPEAQSVSFINTVSAYQTWPKQKIIANIEFLSEIQLNSSPCPLITVRVKSVYRAE